MRYGGYVLFAIPLFMLVSSYASKFKISSEKIYRISVFLIIISIIVFNLRNVIRINKENIVYGYDIVKSPFFFVEQTFSETIYQDNDFKVYSTRSGKACWASKTPCSYNKKIKSDNFLWMKVVLRDVK